MKSRNDPLLNLADFMVEDLLAMSDEEILTECTPEEIEAAKRAKERALAFVNQQQPNMEPK